MEPTKETLKKIPTWLCLLLFLITANIYYLAGAFIAWDLNPANWWISGRIVFVACTIIVYMFLMYFTQLDKE